MMKKIIDTVVREGVHLIKGEPDAEDELQAMRLVICMGCPMLQSYNENKFSCGTFFMPTKNTCGCDVNYKVQYLNEECPQSKW